MSYRQRRFQSPPVILAYEMRRSPYYDSPSSDSEGSSDEDNDDLEHGVVGDMDMDLSDPPVAQKAESELHDNGAVAADNSDEDEMDEETKAELLRKRQGKQPEQSVQQRKADTRAARRRARRVAAEEDEDAYSNAYRPILTIKSSQGFVWNQDLFVPAWQKDRYLCSTSPPPAMSPPSAPSTYQSASAMASMDYEVECVEIRIGEGELDSIVPRSP